MSSDTRDPVHEAAVWNNAGEGASAAGGELLQTTDIPVTDIAFSVGFSSSSYFCRVFKSAYKMCPQGYRTAGEDVR